MNKLITLTIFGLLLSGCGYNRFENYMPADKGALPECTLEIASLRALYGGMRLDVSQDWVVAGRVTTSDRAGNFFRTFVIQDATGAVEIRAGLYDMHRAYPIGTQVAVRLAGLSVGMDYGVLQIGARPLPSSYNQTEYMAHRAIVERFVVRGAVDEQVEPTEVTIAALNDKMCGNLLKISVLRFAGATPVATGPGNDAVSWAVPSGGNFPPSAGYRKFKDPAGDSIVVFTSGYATFASGTIPRDAVSITGVLLHGTAAGNYGRNFYMLKMRSADDAQVR